MSNRLIPKSTFIAGEMGKGAITECCQTINHWQEYLKLKSMNV